MTFKANNKTVDFSELGERFKAPSANADDEESHVPGLRVAWLSRDPHLKIAAWHDRHRKLYDLRMSALALSGRLASS
jgi:hypothetical protein